MQLADPARGLVTKKWARQQMSNVDAAAMEVEEEVERLKNDPNVQALLSQYVQGKLMEALTKRSAAESINNPPPPVPMETPEQQSAPPPFPDNFGKGGPPPTMPVQLNTPLQTVNPPGSPVAIQNQMKSMMPQPLVPTQGAGGGGNRH